MKLTPAELSLEPMRLTIGASHYSFSTQKREGISSTLSVSFAGTQTFNSKGQPVDKDND